MVVGNQATVASVNGQLSSLALSMRNVLQPVTDFQEFVTGLGLPGLEALGFTAADAQTVLNMASYMNTVAEVFFGTAVQTPAFNFSNALCGLWAGN